MLIAVLFTIASMWEQPRCSSTDEWIKMLCYTYTVEYYLAIKKEHFESVLMRWMNLEPIIQSDISQKEKNNYHILTHMEKEWQPTPIFLPGKTHGQRNLVGCSPWHLRVRHDLATKPPTKCIYMKSRQMALMNLFAEQQWRHRHWEQTYGHDWRRGRRRGWEV